MKAKIIISLFFAFLSTSICASQIGFVPNIASPVAGTAAVGVYDLTNGSLLKSITINFSTGELKPIYKVVSNSEGSKIWAIVHEGPYILYNFDIASGTVSASTALPNYSINMVISPLDNKIYAWRPSSNIIEVIDTSSNEVVKSISLSNNIQNLAFSNKGDKAFATLNDGALTTIDSINDEVISSKLTNMLSFDYNKRMIVNDNYIVIPVGSKNTLVIIDRETGEEKDANIALLRDIAPSSDNDIVFVNRYPQILSYNMSTGVISETLIENNDMISLEYNSDLNELYVIGSSRTYVYDSDYAKIDAWAISGEIVMPKTAPVPTSSQISCLFDWAQTSYPTSFSPVKPTVSTYQNYIYRYYDNTDIYLAVSNIDSHVYYMSGSDYVLHDAGPFSTWQPVSGCN